MNEQQRKITKFLSSNKEFSKICKEGNRLKIFLKGSTFEYGVRDFTITNPLRSKLEQLEVELGIKGG